MNHNSSVFRNSCLKVPVDPKSKMPKTAHERKGKRLIEQGSIDSTSTSCSLNGADLDTDKLKKFYRSIPDYKDINHLPSEEFYSTLKSLREKKNVMMSLAIENIDNCSNTMQRQIDVFDRSEDLCRQRDNVKYNDINESKSNNIIRRKFSVESKESEISNNNRKMKPLNQAHFSSNSNTGTCLKRSSRKTTKEIHKSDANLEITQVKYNHDRVKVDRPKRNHSACSISWNDANIEGKTEIDKKFEQFFEGKKYSSSLQRVDFDHNDDFKTQSMPSSPLRMKRCISPVRRRRTIPKPFKMTERDEEDRIVNELRTLQKSFSEDMLHQKCEQKKFKAKPVPIESRIPLYDKILEDQAMRRAITKINSEAELRAQMKPFSFTKREEKGGSGVCERGAHILPKTKKKKRFRARPVPKNLFSNYFYDKAKENEFFRSMNKRIRAEEMLRIANYPGTMGTRDRSHLSTPAAHSDLPIDPSPVVPSTTSSERQRSVSPTKGRRNRDKYSKENFITTSPQPFKFNTADRAAKKMEDVAKKMYEESKFSESGGGSGGDGPGARAYSALELRANATGRSNLAALLRAEAVRRRFEMEADRRIFEQRRKVEMRQRDRLLRTKPAWHLVRNNHEEDIAMRLQTRRDEERMRREEFLHEMELMHGRVQEQPMLFERYYAPRSLSATLDSIQLSPRKVMKKRSSRKSYHFNSPSRSRKVSINDTPEMYNDDVAAYLNIDDKYSYEEVIDSLDRDKL